MRKRILSLLLTLCMVMSLLVSVPALAANETVAMDAQTGYTIEVISNKTANQLTLGVYSDGSLSHGRIELNRSADVNLLSASQVENTETLVSDLDTSQAQSVCFAWASTRTLGKTLLLTLVIGGKAGTPYDLILCETETGAADAYSVTFGSDPHSGYVTFISGKTLVQKDPAPEQSDSAPEDDGYRFRDVMDAGQWYYDAVYHMYRAGIMNGVGDELFNPEGEITRAAVITTLYRMSGSPRVAGTPGFSDTVSGAWYSDAVVWGTANGIITGYTDGTFLPDRAVSRAELTVMLYRWGVSQGTAGAADAAALNRFDDGAQVGAWAVDAMAWAVETGLINGIGNDVAPDVTATRAQAAVILSRLLGEEDGSASDSDTDAGDAADSSDSEPEYEYIYDSVYQPGDYSELTESKNVVVTFQVNPADAEIRLIDGDGDAVSPVKAGMYSLRSGEEYLWFVTRDGYITETGGLAPEQDTAVRVGLERKDSSAPGRTVTVTLVNASADSSLTADGRYQGKTVETFTVSTDEDYVEFGIYANQESVKLDTVHASSGTVNHAGSICILSGFDEDVTVTYTLDYETVLVHFLAGRGYDYDEWASVIKEVKIGGTLTPPASEEFEESLGSLAEGYYVPDGEDAAWYTPHPELGGFDIGLTDDDRTNDGIPVEDWRFNFDTPITKETTLYALWSKKTFTLSFLLNYDGAVDPYDTYVLSYGDRINQQPATPTREGYIFDGWYWDAACTRRYDRTTLQQNITADTQLYAGWFDLSESLPYLYLNGTTGNDENSGKTKDDPIKTFAQAKTLIDAAAEDGPPITQIRVTGQTEVTDSLTVDLTGYDIVVLRDESFSASGRFFDVAAGAQLTLKNVVLDGGATTWTTTGTNNYLWPAADASFCVINAAQGSVVTLESGTEIRNFKSNGYLIGGDAVAWTLTVNDGVSIHDNYVGNRAALFYCYKSGAGLAQITVNGGEFYNNHGVNTAYASLFYVATKNSGDTTARVTINGGSFHDNSCLQESDSAYYLSPATTVTGSTGGLIYAYTNGMPNDGCGAIVEINGGNFEDNVGLGAGLAYLNSFRVNMTVTDGSFENNVRYDGSSDAVYMSNNTNIRLTLDGVADLGGGIRYYGSEACVVLRSSLTEPLTLTGYAGAVDMVVVRGTDSYTLTENDLALIDYAALDSAYELSLDTQNNQIVVVNPNVSAADVGVYLSASGSDENDGLSQATAVATFARAREVLTDEQTSDGANVIWVVPGSVTMSSGNATSMLVVDEDQTWSLAGIPNASVRMTPTGASSIRFMVYVKGATLTLEDITIDGNYYYCGDTDASAFYVSRTAASDKGKLVLKAGATIKDVGYYAAYCYGGEVEMYDGALIDGARPRAGVNGTAGGAIQLSGYTKNNVDWGCSVSIYGGTICNTTRAIHVGNTVDMNQVTNHVVTIHNGTFSNNANATDYAGTVIYNQARGARINIYGGVFENNHSASVGTVVVMAQSNNYAYLTVTGGTFRNNSSDLGERFAGFALDTTYTVSELALPYGSDAVFALGKSNLAPYIAEPLQGTLALHYTNAELSSGAVVAQGSAGINGVYTLTWDDLNKMTVTDKTGTKLTLELDTVGNRIIVK